MQRSPITALAASARAHAHWRARPVPQSQRQQRAAGSSCWQAGAHSDSALDSEAAAQGCGCSVAFARCTIVRS